GGCGNASTARHTIHVDDSTPPPLTGSIPASPVEGCDASASPSATPPAPQFTPFPYTTLFRSTADASLTVSHADVPSGSCPVVITPNEKMTDLYANAGTASQTINVDDSTPPTITGSIPASTVEGCDASAAPAAATTVAQLETLGLSISDACTADASLTVSHADVPSGSCPVVITRTYTVTDGCGNASTASQTINVHASTPPTITGSIPASTVEGCDASAAPAAATT